MTEEVGAEEAEADPPALAAVTTDRTVCPTSVLVSVYALSVAPLMFEQVPPDVSQSCHW